MSGRPLDSGRPGSSASEHRHYAGPLQHPSVSAAARFSHTAASSPSQSSPVGARGFELPPLPTSNPAPRLAGVSALLNSHAPDDAQQPDRRRKASALEATSVPLPPFSQNVDGAVAQHYGSGPLPSPAASERPPRRILSPRSPSLHRTASLNQLHASTGAISARQTPFPTSPRGHVSSLPLNTPLSVARHGSGAVSSGYASLKGSVSPTTSQFSQSSSSAPYAPTAMSTLAASYETPGHPSFSGSERQQAVGIPISSSGGQNVYQMMTLETTSGRVQLPVDVQAASRVADEKRRRNAGASARFRQRRKEKEKEASTTISRLEQRLKDLGDDLEFYKRERDYLAGVVRQVPGGERHFPRPPSPRRRRSSSNLSGPSISSSTGYRGPSEETQRYTGSEDGRNVRRRTSAISLTLPPPPAPAQQPSPMLHQSGPFQPGFASGYGSQQPPPPHQQHPGPSPGQFALSPGAPPRPGPPSFQHSQHGAPPTPNHHQVGPPPATLHAPPQTGPWNPYARDHRHSSGGGPGA